jgi:hypothetical protein
MGNQFKFWWSCIQHAWRGCWTRANELAAVIGGGLLTGLLWIFSPYLGAHGWVEAPTSYIGVTALATATAIASVAVTFVLIFLIRFPLTPARLYWEEHKRSDILNADLRRARGDGQAVKPNWPIHELFSYLEPSALDEPDKALWEDASLKIRDAASLGQLRIWGRLFKTDLGDWLGELASLREIDKTYWQKAFFTYLFFDATAGEKAAHCYADRNTGVPAYTDLQINREEAIKLWPGEPDDMADSYPNVRVADSPAVIELFDGSDRAKLLALLSAGKISSWARLSSRKRRDLIKLDGKIWTSHTFLFFSKDGEGRINQTFLQAKGYSSNYDVCMNYAQLKREWPDLSIHRVTCDVG